MKTFRITYVMLGKIDRTDYIEFTAESVVDAINQFTAYKFAYGDGQFYNMTVYAIKSVEEK